MIDPEELPIAILPMWAVTNTGLLQNIDVSLPLFVPGVRGHGMVDEARHLDLAVVAAARRFDARVELRQIYQGDGIRNYFVCPRCGRPVIELVFATDRVMCGDCFINHGPFGRKANRRRYLRQAKQRLVRPPRRRFRGDEQRRARHAADDERDGRELRGDIVPWELSTEAAVVGAISASGTQALASYLEWPAHHWVTQGFGSYARPATVASMADTPVLNIQALTRLCPFERGNLRAICMTWPKEATGGHELILIADHRLAKPFVMIAHNAESTIDPAWQRLDVDVDARGRMRFICPVTAKRCEQLFLRGGAFASRQKQRLSYPSQRGARREAPQSNAGSAAINRST